MLLGEVRQLVGDAHPGIQPPLFRHVAEPQPRLLTDRRSLPTHLAALGDDEAEDAAHGGGLAGAVGPEEAHEAAAPALNVAPSSAVIGP